jgi:hypothetical protein
VLTYEELMAQKTSTRTSTALDSSRLHTYLSEGEFERVFGRGKADFADQPRWKQINQRKKAGLWS